MSGVVNSPEVSPSVINDWMEGMVVGSRPTGCMSNLPIKKEKRKEKLSCSKPIGPALIMCFTDEFSIQYGKLFYDSHTFIFAI